MLKFATAVVWWVGYSLRKGIGRFEEMEAVKCLHPAMLGWGIIRRGCHRNIVRNEVLESLAYVGSVGEKEQVGLVGDLVLEGVGEYLAVDPAFTISNVL